MIHMNHRHGTLAVLGALALLTGCEDERLPPPPPPPEDTVPDRPTTQALLEGPRKTVHLELIPFAVQVPESWKLESKQTEALPITILEGPMPYDQGAISIHLRETVSASMVKLWIERIPKEDADARARGGSKTLRTIDDIQIIELRRLSTPVAPPTTAPTTGPTTAPTTAPALEPLPLREGSMEWRVTILAPRGIRYEWYELKVIGLTDDLYLKNEAFLSAIFNSLKPAAPPALPPM